MPEDEDIERNPINGLISVGFWVLLVILLYHFTYQDNPLSLGFLTSLIAIVPLAYFTYLVASYVPKDENESRLHGLKPALRYIPVIKKPDGHVCLLYTSPSPRD